LECNGWLQTKASSAAQHSYFERNREGSLLPESASKLYNIYRHHVNDAEMNLVFRDHSLSDLIGSSIPECLQPTLPNICQPGQSIC